MPSFSTRFLDRLRAALRGPSATVNVDELAALLSVDRDFAALLMNEGHLGTFEFDPANSEQRVYVREVVTWIREQIESAFNAGDAPNEAYVRALQVLQQNGAVGAREVQDLLFASRPPDTGTLRASINPHTAIRDMPAPLETMRIAMDVDVSRVQASLETLRHEIAATQEQFSRMMATYGERLMTVHGVNSEVVTRLERLEAQINSRAPSANWRGEQFDDSVQALIEDNEAHEVIVDTVDEDGNPTSFRETVVDMTEIQYDAENDAFLLRDSNSNMFNIRSHVLYLTDNARREITEDIQETLAETAAEITRRDTEITSLRQELRYARSRIDQLEHELTQSRMELTTLRSERDQRTSIDVSNPDLPIHMTETLRIRHGMFRQGLEAYYETNNNEPHGIVRVATFANLLFDPQLRAEIEQNSSPAQPNLLPTIDRVLSESRVSPHVVGEIRRLFQDFLREHPEMTTRTFEDARSTADAFASTLAIPEGGPRLQRPAVPADEADANAFREELVRLTDQREEEAQAPANYLVTVIDRGSTQRAAANPGMDVPRQQFRARSAIPIGSFVSIDSEGYAVPALADRALSPAFPLYVAVDLRSMIETDQRLDGTIEYRSRVPFGSTLRIGLTNNPHVWRDVTVDANGRVDFSRHSDVNPDRLVINSTRLDERYVEVTWFERPVSSSR